MYLSTITPFVGTHKLRLVYKQKMNDNICYILLLYKICLTGEIIVADKYCISINT